MLQFVYMCELHSYVTMIVKISPVITSRDQQEFLIDSLLLLNFFLLFSSLLPLGICRGYWVRWIIYDIPRPSSQNIGYISRKIYLSFIYTNTNTLIKELLRKTCRISAATMRDEIRGRIEDIYRYRDLRQKGCYRAYNTMLGKENTKSWINTKKRVENE